MPSGVVAFCVKEVKCWA